MLISEERQRHGLWVCGNAFLLRLRQTIKLTKILRPPEVDFLNVIPNRNARWRCSLRNWSEGLKLSWKTCGTGQVVAHWIQGPAGLKERCCTSVFLGFLCFFLLKSSGLVWESYDKKKNNHANCYSYFRANVNQKLYALLITSNYSQICFLLIKSLV